MTLSLKKYLLLSVLISTTAAYSQVFRNDGEVNVSAGYLVLSGEYQNESDAVLTLDGIITLDGDWTNNSSTTCITGAETDGEIIFLGTSTQTIGGSASQTNFEKLTINSDAIVDITAGKYVTALGATDISGTFNLRSGAGGTASFISEGTVSGSGTSNAERYLSYNTWHNVSSSTYGQSLNAFLTSGANDIPTKDGGATYGSEFYDEANGVWTYFTTTNAPGAGLLLRGIAYLVRRGTSDGVVTFTGALNSGAISPTVTTSRFGWNSVGNPYSSSIGFNTGSTATNFLDANTSNLEASFVAGYFWNGTSYDIINNADAATYIQPGQGFLIRAASGGGGSVDFTSAMQTHSNPTFYKKAIADWDKVLIIAKTDIDSASTKIFFREDMSRGLDISYDAGYFGGDDTFRLYTQLVETNGVDFMLQCLPSLEIDTMIIPLGFDCFYGGLVKFEAEISSLPSGYTAILEDRQLDIFTNLNEAGAYYEVPVNAETKGYGRFFLHSVALDPIDIVEEIKDNFKIYNYRKEVVVKGFVENNTRLMLFDLTGKKRAEFLLDEGDENRVYLNDGIQTGIYIIRVYGPKVNETAKLFIN
jgi:hypothetical protein